MGKSEKELHTAVLSVPLPICIINEQGKDVYKRQVMTL